MTEYPYVIIGGGMTAAAALKGIRSADAYGGIGVFSSEAHPPYKRPPLSKGLWKGEPQESIWMPLPTSNATLHLSSTITRIDPQQKRVFDAQGMEYGYDKLLLATGGKIRTLPGNTEGIIYYRTFDDYLRLRALSEEKESFLIIGGGFIGSEVAAALRLTGKQVTIIFPEAAIGVRVYPAGLAQFLNKYYEEKGVTVLAGDSIQSLRKAGDRYHAVTTSGRNLEVDVVVAGIGIQPDTTLAESAGVKVDNGIVTNSFLQTNMPDIYAAGDAASFHNSALGKTMRVEHEDNALKMGETAGLNMGGKPTPYDYLPFFYSDLFDLGYEAVGETDPRLKTYADWKKQNEEGVIYYLSAEGRVRGIILWNTWGQVDNARALIAEPGPFDARSLKGRLPA